jgi:hypothetical protein
MFDFQSIMPVVPTSQEVKIVLDERNGSNVEADRSMDSDSSPISHALELPLKPHPTRFFPVTGIQKSLLRPKSFFLYFSTYPSC